MRFHDWQSAKSDFVTMARDEGRPAEEVRRLRSLDSCDLLRSLMRNEMDSVAAEVAQRPNFWRDRLDATARRPVGNPEDVQHLHRVSLGYQAILRYQCELDWLECGRPFYNVYPIVLSLAAKTSLDFPLRRVRVPFPSILLRFPAGHEPCGFRTALVCTDILNPALPGARRHPFVALSAGISPRTGDYSFTMSTIEDYGDESITVEQSMSKQLDSVIHCISESEIHPDTGETYAASADRIRTNMTVIFRLAVIAAQLSEGRDLITPIVLEKDRSRHDRAGEAEKRWLEERAARVAGRGFDFGRELQRNSETSPHWRNPHLALFHTGEGRRIPVLKLRAGCVVLPRHLSEVPTGFLGPERPEECDRPPAPLVYRTPIPKRLRFQVLRRDKYRCRLCGLSRDDGVTLEVDHRVPVAKGGASTLANLWTLCHPCNNGKSDSDLHGPALSDHPEAEVANG